MCLHCLATQTEVGYFGPDYAIRTSARKEHKELQERGLCEDCNKLAAQASAEAARNARPEPATADR
jgi:hypothetical protein